jgi:low affinity Fe/Cu permease
MASERTISVGFDRLARLISNLLGSLTACVAAIALIVAWSIGGIWFGYTDVVYQLIINTTTSIITFLMVFIIQHTQIRDTEAMHLKLDELIRAIADARNEYRGLELRTEEEMRKMKTIDDGGVS